MLSSKKTEFSHACLIIKDGRGMFPAKRRIPSAPIVRRNKADDPCGERVMTTAGK